MTKSQTELPLVSIVIPCYNEIDHIGKCLDSILSNDYPHNKIEVLIGDGMSNDGTRSLVAEYTKTHAFIHLLDNPKRQQQLALNIGITNAKGQIILRMDAHSTYKSNYISECVNALLKFPADNVGGRWVIVPRNTGLVARSICMAVTSWFGVGNAYYRLTSLKHANQPALSEPKWEINVAYFCCRKEVFENIGLFNENLNRSEDIDFRTRLKKAGLRTLFVPTIECYYSMRTHYLDFVRHMFKNGVWVIKPLQYTPQVSFSWRHIVPLLFIMGLFVLLSLTFTQTWARILLTTGISLYTIISFYFAIRIAWREKRTIYFFLLPFIYLSLHAAYGIGSLTGLLEYILWTPIKRLCRFIFPQRSN